MGIRERWAREHDQRRLRAEAKRRADAKRAATVAVIADLIHNGAVGFALEQQGRKPSPGVDTNHLSVYEKSVALADGDSHLIRLALGDPRLEAQRRLVASGRPALPRRLLPGIKRDS